MNELKIVDNDSKEIAIKENEGGVRSNSNQASPQEDFLNRLPTNIRRVGVHMEDDFVGITISNLRRRLEKKLKGVSPIKFTWKRPLLEAIPLFFNLAIVNIPAFGFTISGEAVHALVYFSLLILAWATWQEWTIYKKVRKFSSESIEELIEDFCEDLFKYKEKHNKK